MKHRTAIALLALPLLLAACAAPEQNEAKGAEAGLPQNSLVSVSYKAGDALLAQLGGKLEQDKPLIMATIVNIDALEQSSTLGRLLSEQISTRLVQGGVKMVEMKLRNNVYLKRNQGELMLTREIGEVALAHHAQAIVVGSYADSKELVFVNIKVIQPNTNYVLAGYDFVLHKDGTLRSMLTQG
jgi:TolB-like protein